MRGVVHTGLFIVVLFGAGALARRPAAAPAEGRAQLEASRQARADTTDERADVAASRPTHAGADDSLAATRAAAARADDPRAARATKDTKDTKDAGPKPPDRAPDDARAALREVRAAKADRSARGERALARWLGSDDPIVVAEAADGLVARRAAGAIPALAAIDVHANPTAALSVIDALGRLAACADGPGKDAAVARLIALVAEEKRRAAPDRAGNLLGLYEALGETRDPRAAPALEAELDDPSVTNAAKVVVVRALALVDAPTSRAVVIRARARVWRATEADAFEEEVREELVAAIDSALHTLR